MSAPNDGAEDLGDDKLLWHLPRSGFGRPMLGGIPLLRRLGKGAMGAVYFAHHPRLDVDVAIKILPYLLVEEEPLLLDRFLSEGRVAAALQSDHVVRVLDVNCDGETHYIVMEYVAGESAKAYLRRVGTPGLPERDALDVVIAATRGLAAAHAKRIVHRDVKPDNILIPKGELKKAKLADLGLAKPQWGGESVGTKSQALLGTPGFMSPEQIIESRTAAPTADVWGMGATLHMLLTGRAPYSGETMMRIVAATLQKEPDPLPSTVHPSIFAIVSRCLARNPKKRFQEGAELLAALEQAETGSSYKTEWLPEFKAVEIKTSATQPSIGTLPDAQDLPPPLPMPVAAQKPSPPRRRNWLAPALVVLLLAAGIGAWRYLAAARERAWQSAKSAADTVNLRHAATADDWRAAIEKLDRAAGFKRDVGYEEQLRVASRRLLEQETWERATTADVPEQLKLAGQLAEGADGLRSHEAASLFDAARTLAAGEWEKTSSRSRDFAAVEAYRRRYAGTDFEQRAIALAASWIDADWVAVQADVRQFEDREEYAPAASRVSAFLALPQHGGHHASEAKREELRLREEALLTLDEYLLLAPAAGREAFRDGRYRDAIDAWAEAARSREVFVCICAAALRLSDVNLAEPTQRKAADVLSALTRVESLGAWPRLSKLRQRAEDQDIPDDARDAWVQAQALAASAGDDPERWYEALVRYRRAQSGVIANLRWREAAKLAVANAEDRALGLLRKQVAAATGTEEWQKDLPSVRQAWRAVGRALKIAPLAADLQAVRKRIQDLPAFAPVFAWEDAVQAAAEAPTAMARFELLAGYQANHPTPAFPDELAPALSKADDDAFAELSKSPAELAERVRQAERYAKLSARGEPLLKSLRAERVYRDAMAKAAESVKRKAWKESCAFFEEALAAKPADKEAAAGLKASYDAIARDPMGWVEIQTVTAHTGAIRSVAWSRDSQLLATGSDDGAVKLWDPAGRHQKTFSPGKTVNAVTFLANGACASGGDDGVRVWPDRGVATAAARALAAAGDHLAMASGKRILLWHADEPLVALDGHGDTVSAIAAANGVLASGSWDATVRLWDLKQKKEVHSFSGHAKPVQSIAIDAAARLIVSAGRDGQIILWDAAARKELRRIAVQAQSVALSPDGTLIAACGSGWVRIWEAATGADIRSFAVPSSLHWAIAFRPDGKSIAVASMDGSLRLWGAKP